MTYIFARKHGKRTAILRACHTYKARGPVAAQQMAYTLEQDNHERIELTGDQLHANWRQVQPTPRKPRPGRYTSTRGQRRRDALGRGQ